MSTFTNSINSSRRCNVCVRGHVDTGKTSLLDKLASHTIDRAKTSISGTEAGGITQQVGTTTFTEEHLRQFIPTTLRDKFKMKFVMIDTPGHTDFDKIRRIGSKIAHITLIMVDITKGIDADTLEYLQNDIKTDSDYDTTIIVLNKMDKIYAYDKLESINEGHCSLKRIMNNQPKMVISKLNEYMHNVSVQLAQIGLYGEPYYNKKCRECLAMIPISAISGDGIPDLLLYMSNARMELEGGKKLNIETILLNKLNELDVSDKSETDHTDHTDGALDKSKSLGYILDKRLDDTHGKIIIGILKYGSISKTDSIRIGPNNYPINTLMRTAGYSDSRQGQFIPAETVDYAISFIIKVDPSIYDLINLGDEFTVSSDRTIRIDESVYDELDARKREIFSDHGVHIIIPSESMLEAFHSHFQHENIPIQSCSIGTMSKSEIIKYINKQHKFATVPDYSKRYKMIIICTPDRPDSSSSSTEQLLSEYIEPDKIQMLNAAGIKVMFGGTIYKLASKFNEHRKNHIENMISRYGSFSNFDADLIPKYVFRNEDPIVCGIKLNSGAIVLGSEVCSSDRSKYYGKVTGIQLEMRDIEVVHPGMDVCLKLVGGTHKLTKGEPAKFVNKTEGLINSEISRLVSEDILKTKPKPSVPKVEKSDDIANGSGAGTGTSSAKAKGKHSKDEVSDTKTAKGKEKKSDQVQVPEYDSAVSSKGKGKKDKKR
jgi:translation initiation factor 5B